MRARPLAGMLSATALVLIAAACQKAVDTPAADSRAPEPAPVEPASVAPAPPPAAPATVDAAPVSTDVAGPDAWLGKWTGPEGTSLVLEPKQGGGYRVTITNLDGPATYEGEGAGQAIAFVRDGQSETIHAGNDVQTGMKWLAQKQDCLVVRTGEGYCRD